MARRRKSKNKSGLIFVLLGAILLATIVGSLLIKRQSDPFAALTELNVTDYLENANSLRGNTYKIKGSIDERLDEWPSGDGRLFSLIVDRDGIEGGAVEVVPVHVPADFNGRNIQRDQEYNMEIEVSEGGLLVAREFEKT